MILARYSDLRFPSLLRVYGLGNVALVKGVRSVFGPAATLGSLARIS